MCMFNLGNPLNNHDLSVFVHMVNMHEQLKLSIRANISCFLNLSRFFLLFITLSEGRVYDKQVGIFLWITNILKVGECLEEGAFDFW